MVMAVNFIYSHGDEACGYYMANEDADPLNHYYVMWARWKGKEEGWRTPDLMTEKEMRDKAVSLLHDLKGVK